MRTRDREGMPLAVLIAVVAWMGVALQLYLSLRLANASGMSMAQGVANYFSYFTVLTNILVGVAVTLPLAWPSSAAGRFFAQPHVVGWMTVSIVFVGVAYHVLLRHLWHPQGLQWLADVTMHYAVPALVILYSVLVLAPAALRWSAPLWWSLYPVVYFVYVLIRGAWVGRYPYPFIDASRLGYAVTLRNAVFLWVAFVMLAYVLMGLWRGLGHVRAALSPRGRTQP